MGDLLREKKMNKELNDLQDIKSAFISHCKELGCDESYIKVCENKFSDIETTIKALEIIKPLVYIFWNMGGYGEIRLAESGRRIKQYIPKNEYELLKKEGFEERYYVEMS